MFKDFPIKLGTFIFTSSKSPTTPLHFRYAGYKRVGRSCLVNEIVPFHSIGRTGWKNMVTLTNQI